MEFCLCPSPAQNLHRQKVNSKSSIGNIEEPLEGTKPNSKDSFLLKSPPKIVQLLVVLGLQFFLPLGVSSILS